MRYRFDRFELDTEAGRLTRDGGEVPIRGKPLALLATLVRHRDRICTAEELLAEVWPDVAVSVATLATTLRDARRILGDDGADSRFIRTLRGRGYRFVHPVSELGGETSARLVGRNDLLETAAHNLSEAAGGSGSALFLDGEAGIGKTALALEISRLARERGFSAHLGRCLEEAGTPAYWPWIQVLRGVLDGRRPEDLPIAWQAPLAEVRTLLAGAATPTESAFAPEDPGLRFRLFDAIGQILVAAARERPRLLVLDDLHRADGSSLLLLGHVLDELPGAPVVLLGAYRGGEAPDALPQRIREAGSWVTRSALTGLAHPDVATLLDRTLGRPAAPELTDIVFERTAGNPLFVEEMSRALEAEAVEGAEAVERTRRLAPQGVREATRVRVARLAPRTRDALCVAAVAGREFDVDVVARAAETEPTKIARALDAALSVGLVEELPRRPGRLRFRHILVRDALYANLSRSRRAALHARVGEALEALRAGNLDAHLDELAHHFLQSLDADQAQRAVTYARRAGERDLASAAYEEAAERFEAALVASNLVEGETAGAAFVVREQAELRVLLGQARWRAGAPTQARAAFEAAAGQARRLGDGEILARAALGWAGRTDATQGVDQTAVQLLEEARDALPSTDGAVLAEVLARLSSELYGSADWQRGRELVDEAVAMAERLGDSALLAYTLSAQRYALMRPDGEPSRRLAIGERLIELARSSGAGDVLTLGLQDHVVDLLEQGDGPRMNLALRRFGEHAAALRQPFFAWMHSAFVGMRILLSGRVAEAEAQALDTLARGQAFETPNAGSLYAAQLYCIRRQQGRLPEMVSLLESASEAQPQLPLVRAALASTLGAAGRSTEAHTVLQQIVARGLEELPFDEHHTACLATLVEPALAAGEPQLIRQLYMRLGPLAGRIVVVAHGAGSIGAVSLYLGPLAAALGDNLTAEEHLEAAVALHRRLGTPLWSAHAEAALARLLWKTGNPGDRDRARHLADAARDTYAALGLEHHVSQVEEIPPAA